MVKRRKMLIGMGALAAGSAAGIGTGAFEGAYFHAERNVSVGVVNDSDGYLALIPTSEYASEGQGGQGGGWDNGQGTQELVLNLTGLNANMDTRLDDVFRVRNTTGSSVTLMIEDSPDWNGSTRGENAFQVWAQPVSGGSPTRLDEGGSVELGAGEAVEINIYVLLRDWSDGGVDPNGSTEPNTLTITADGTDSSA